MDDSNGGFFFSPIQSPVLIFTPPPPFPGAPRSVDLSALKFVLAIIALISIPLLIFTLLFALRCPRAAEPLPSRSGECPVCLSAFGEGDDVKPLSACGHAFHTACVDEWLSSNPNCPVCRAEVPSADLV